MALYAISKVQILYTRKTFFLVITLICPNLHTMISSSPVTVGYRQNHIRVYKLVGLGWCVGERGGGGGWGNAKSCRKKKYCNSLVHGISIVCVCVAGQVKTVYRQKLAQYL